MNDKQDAARRLGETIEIEGEVRVGNSDVPTPVARVTPAELAEWRALTDAATEGPWDADVIPHDPEEPCVPEYANLEPNIGAGLTVADAGFIALARIAMPRLLDEVARLREEATVSAALLETEIAKREAAEMRANRATADLDALESEDRRQDVQAKHWREVLRIRRATERPESIAPRHPGATQSPSGYPSDPPALNGPQNRAERVSDAEAAEWARLADAVTEGSWHFIALARTAVPRLLADRERLTGEASRVPVLLADKAALMGDVDRLTAERDGARLMRVIATRAFETTRRVLQEASGLPDDIDDPDCRDEMVLALRPRAEKAEAEVERLRETVTRLNRRAQIAESAINDLTREPIGGREHAPVAAEVWARCEETHGLVCRAAREARAEVSSLRTLLDPDGKATERLLEAPMMSPLEWAQKALGCARGGTGEGGDEHYCRTHPGLKRAWPCLRATRLAALIEARDCEVQANECEAIAAELSDEHREALFLGGANQPGTWGSVAAHGGAVGWTDPT